MVINMASRAETCLRATVYRRYGRPSWNIPATARSSHPRRPGDDPSMKGILMRVARMLPKITVSSAEPSFCFRKNSVTQPKQKPLTTATIVPKKLACVRSSAKKSAIPPIITRIVNQSVNVVRSPRKAVLSKAIQIGAV